MFFEYSLNIVFNTVLVFMVTIIFSGTFLDASTHLYKRVCPSVRRSVGWSVGRSPVFFQIAEIDKFDKSDKSNTFESDKSDRILQI